MATVVHNLQGYMDSDTLVVGPVLEGHAFVLGNETELRGQTCPWNTLAIWSLHKLGQVGFPAIGDGYLSTALGGVEVLIAGKSLLFNRLIIIIY